LDVTIDNFLTKGNVSYDSGHEALTALNSAIQVLNSDYLNEIKNIQSAIQGLVDIDADTADYDARDYAGLALCGERRTFRFIDVSNDEGDDEDGNGNGNGNGGNGTDPDPGEPGTVYFQSPVFQG
jgi:hypothetical protein